MFKEKWKVNINDMAASTKHAIHKKYAIHKNMQKGITVNYEGVIWEFM